MKNLPVLNYTENSKFPPLAGHLALGLIDKKKKTCQSRETNDENFSRYKGTIFFKCLESFSNIFQSDCKSILFCAENHTEKLAEFIEKIEKQLKVPITERSLIFKTSDSKISAIRVSKFWLADPMRQKTFSLFIRASIYYQLGGTVNDAIKKYPLAKNCLPFFVLFLEGFVNFHDDILEDWKVDFHHGIIASFQNLTREEILSDNLLFK